MRPQKYPNPRIMARTATPAITPPAMGPALLFFSEDSGVDPVLDPVPDPVPAPVEVEPGVDSVVLDGGVLIGDGVKALAPSC